LRYFSDSTLKDVDFLNLVENDILCLEFSDHDVTLIANTLKRDLAFLEANKLMDYSLLLGIEKVNILGTQDERPFTKLHTTASEGKKDINGVDRS